MVIKLMLLNSGFNFEQQQKSYKNTFPSNSNGLIHSFLTFCYICKYLSLNAKVATLRESAISVIVLTVPENPFIYMLQF